MRVQRPEKANSVPAAVAVVLAGGRGNRMGLLCEERPKPLLPFGGVFRVIDFSLTNCVHSGIHNIVVLADYLRQEVRHYLEDAVPWRKAGALEVLDPGPGSYSGTAGAVFQNLPRLEASGAEVALVLAADHIYKMDYRPMLAFHRAKGADVTVAVTRVPLDEAHRFGMLEVDEGERVRAFLEKPRVPSSALASMGVYVFNIETLAQRLAEDARDSSSAHDFGMSLLPRLTKLDRVFAYEFRGYWRDIGTIDSYYQTNMEAISRSPSFSLGGGWPASSGAPFPERDRSSIIGPGCVVQGRVERSVLGPGVHVEPQAVVRDSLLMANVVVGRHSIVERAILDEDVRVGGLSYVGFGYGLAPDSSQVTVVGRGAVIPPHTAVGRNCRVLPGTRPADFRSAVVAPGTLVAP